MEIPHESWYQAIPNRHSRRRFLPDKKIPPDIWDKLLNTAHNFRPFAGIRLELADTAAETVFKGALGTYGKVKGASAYLVVIADIRQSNFQEAAGYTGEGLILEATNLGLSTCWVGGFFNPYAAARQLSLQPGERVMAVSPIGYAEENRSLEERVMSGLIHSHKRLPLSAFVSGIETVRYPAWLPEALEAVRLAPSAENRQPWRLYIESNAVLFSTAGASIESGVSRRLDCGIAMLHFDIAARRHAVIGSWEFLETPQVARFSFYNNLLK